MTKVRILTEKFEHAKNLGMKAENYFISKLNEKGIPYEFKDDYFDFLVCNEKVEVKSTQMTVRNYQGKKKGWRVGRFVFTKKENRLKIIEENIWVCFIIRHFDQFIILGFIQGKHLKDHEKMSIHEIRDLKPIDFDEFLKKVNE